jgi:glucose 1-dehydrogenase
VEGIKGKNVLVTGATSGIGQAIAARFAVEGANVAINYRNDPDKVKDTQELIDQMCSQVRGCGGKELLVEGDVSEEKDIIRMCEEVASAASRKSKGKRQKAKVIFGKGFADC